MPSPLIFSSIALFLLMLAAQELGHRFGANRRKKAGEIEGSGVPEGAVFALLGLMIAFSFSGAASRFEARRALINQEVNAIGTAYLRLDVLPKASREPIQKLFREYVEIRLEASRLQHRPGVELYHDRAEVLQTRIWKDSVAASSAPDAPTQALMLLVPALNEMIDITTTRLTATRNHPPLVIFGLLGAFSIVGALLVGFAMSKNATREWFHPVLFAVVMAATFYVTLDLEFPRRGLIRIDSADLLFEELKESLKASS